MRTSAALAFPGRLLPTLPRLEAEGEAPVRAASAATQALRVGDGLATGLVNGLAKGLPQNLLQGLGRIWSQFGSRLWPGRAGAGCGAITAILLGEQQLLVRVEAAASAGGRPRLRAAEVAAADDDEALRQWRRDGLLRRSQPLLVLRCADRQLLTMDHPQVADAELAQAARWPLAEAMEAEAESLLATAMPLPRINDAQRTQVLAVGAHVAAVRAQLQKLEAAGIRARSIDIIDTALRGMALLDAQAQADPSVACVALVAVGRELCIGLLWQGQVCALRTLAMSGGAPRDAAAFEEQLALHIQRTTDLFERQATQLAVRDVLGLLPSLQAQAAEDVRQMLPLRARWFEPGQAFDISPEAARGLERAEDLLPLACVAAARLLAPQPAAPGAAPEAPSGSGARTEELRA